MKFNENGTPIAVRKQHEIEQHGDKRNDPYYWMRLTDEQKNAETPDDHTKEVLDHLNAENAYLKKVLSRTEDLQTELYEEMVGRIKQDDQSVPYLENGFYYLTKYEEGQEFPVFSRKKENLEAEEILLLNVNELAKDHAFYQIGGLSISPDNKLLAYGEDTKSRRKYTLKFKEIGSDVYLKDKITNTTGHAVWGNDNKTIFYTVKDSSLRSYKIYRHKLGTNPKEDIEVFHEKDESFITFISKTKSKKYLVIGSASTLSNEFRFLDASQPDGEFKIFQKRQEKLEYSISHFEDQWFMRTNLDAVNFKIMTCPLDKTKLENWVDYIPHNEEILVEGMDIFRNFFVVNERIDGITQLRVINRKGESHYISFPEDNHLVFSGKNPDYDTEWFRLRYTSMISPLAVYDYHLENRGIRLMKQQEVLGGFDSSNYKTERINATSPDGKSIPISLVYHKDTKKNGQNPLLLYGYGSYGISLDPYFSSIRLSLLDRGFIYAIANVRGGEELGRKWYEDGKMLNKKNSFDDFICVAEYLKENKFVHPEKLFAMGGSAGGLLMGAVINMRPDLWKGIIAAVPFVDVLTTMLDESIPLTTGEFDEWGNPKDEAYYHYIKSYSPYDNIEPKSYPAMLVTTGFHDSQVQYWEPAKWVARLREFKKDNNPLLFHCDMDTGHGGASGRFKQLKETALEYAFLLWLLQKPGKSE
jgi:oligopeptidase B